MIKSKINMLAKDIFSIKGAFKQFEREKVKESVAESLSSDKDHNILMT